MLASHTKGIKQHQSTHLPPPPKLSTPPGSTTGQNIQVKQHFTAKARTVRIKAKRLKHWHVYKKTNQKEREFQHLLLLLVLLLSSFELMLIPDLSVDNSSYQAMNSRTMTTVYSLSADPCSGEGRGGAWDHRRCRTFAFVKGCSKTSRLLDCGLWALCGTVGGVAQTVGSGLWRAKSLFFLWPETALQTPQTPQTLRHLPMVLPYFWILDASDAPWTLQTLQNLALARLWALGSVRDCGRSCADCVAQGSGAPNPFFLVARNCPSKTPQTLRRLPMVLPYFWILDASDAPWTLQTLQNLVLARLWALGSVRDCERSCADCGLGALARQIFFF